LVVFLEHLRETRVELFLHQQGFATTRSSGAMFGMLSVFAQFERSIIRERLMAGMARAKVKGTRSGKAIGRPAIALRTRDAIRDAYKAGGLSLRTVARKHSVGVATVRRCLAEIEQAGCDRP
jgi:DNA invertase Pin-like site-specific DNA recombinase